jgi:hypothetical protein
MPDDLSDDQISLLCNISDKARFVLGPQDTMRSDLETLLRGGYAEVADDQSASPYQLTAKGIAFLSERGAGLNEA